MAERDGRHDPVSEVHEGQGEGIVAERTRLISEELRGLELAQTAVGRPVVLAVSGL